MRGGVLQAASFFLDCTDINFVFINLGDCLARQFQNPERVKVVSVPATEHGAIQAANTAMFGAMMQAGNLGLPRGATEMPFRVTFAKEPRLIPKNQEILEAGAQAVRVLEMGVRR